MIRGLVRVLPSPPVLGGRATVLIVKGEKRMRQLGSREHERCEFGIVGSARADHGVDDGQQLARHGH